MLALQTVCRELPGLLFALPLWRQSLSLHLQCCRELGRFVYLRQSPKDIKLENSGIHPVVPGWIAKNVQKCSIVLVHYVELLIQAMLS